MADKNCQEIIDVKKDLFVKYKDKVLRLVLPENQIVTWRDVSEVISSAFGFSNLKFNYIIEGNQTACIHNQETFEQAVYEYKITNFELDCDLVDSQNISPCSYGELLIQENYCSSSSSDDATDSTVVNMEREDELLINPYTETSLCVSSNPLIVLPETGESVNIYSNNLSSVPDYVNTNYLQNQLDSFRCRDYTVFYHGNGYERIPDGELPVSLGVESKKKKKELSEKCVGNSEIDLIDFNKDKAKKKKKKDSLENIALTPVQRKGSDLSVFVPVKECNKSPSCSKSDKNKKESPVENEEREHYVYVPIFGKEYCKSPCSKSDKNKKEKREKKHKSCTISKNHPFLACVKENCATKYEEWKKMLQKYVNPETSDKPPKWFLEFMKQYKQDIIHDVVHKTTRRIFKATEGLGGPLNCCRSKPNELKLAALMLDKENKAVLDSTADVLTSDEKPNHGKVICDGCNNLIEGIWYRCCNCSDYDLCEACENRPDIHDVNHVFLKIRKPLTNQGKQFLIKKSPLLDDILYDDIPPLSPNDEESKFQLCSYDCKFIKDETIPDGIVLQPKTKFVKSWLVRNNGNVPWDSFVKLQFMWGTLPPPTFEIRVPPLKIGEEGLVSVELTVPEKPGHYESHWQLRRHKRRFGPRIWCSVEVEGAKPMENRINVNAILKSIYHVQISKSAPEEDIRPSNDQIEKESVYKSVSEFISQTTTPNNTPLEFSPPRSPDPNVDLLGIVKSMAHSTINEDKLENVAKHEESAENGELQTLEQCPQEFFVDAEESLPLEGEAGISTPLSPNKLNNESPLLTPTDSSMEVLSEDEEDDQSENPDMHTALNTSALSVCSDNDYVMVPWPECFVLESSCEGENSKDEDVIIYDGIPSDDAPESDLADYLHWSLGFPKHFATYDSRERNNNYVFIPEKLSSASPTNFSNEGEEAYNKETSFHINCVSCKHEGEPPTSPELQLLLNKCIPNKTKNHPGISEFSKANYEACDIELSPVILVEPGQKTMEASEFKTPIASPQAEISPDSASMAGLPMYTILMPKNNDQKSVLPATVLSTVNKQETVTSSASSDFLPKPSASQMSDEIIHEKSLTVESESIKRPIGFEFSNTIMTHPVVGNNFSSPSQKEIKEKVIFLTPSSFTFEYPTPANISSVTRQQQTSNGNQSPVNDQILYSCDTRLESPTSPTDGCKSFQPSEVTRENKPNDVQWNQILADQMMPHSASQVAANLMNTALTAGALALNTAKAVFNTLQAKQNESQEASEENTDKDTVPKCEVQPTPMEQLMEMGFCDRALNTQALQQSNNDLGEAVSKLLALTDNDWHQRR